MTTDQELQDLKDQVAKVIEKSSRQFKLSIIVIVVLAFITMVSVLYAFIQNTKAMRASNEEVANSEEARTQKLRADKNDKIWADSLKKELEKCKTRVVSEPK